MEGNPKFTYSRSYLIKIVVKNYEKSLVQNKFQNEHKNVRRRELVENFEAGRLLPEVKYFDLLYDVSDSNIIILKIGSRALIKMTN